MTEIAIQREHLEYLLELAEECLYLQDTEFSNSPTQRDKKHLIPVYELLAKDITPYLKRKFNSMPVADSEVDPDV